MIQLFAAKQNSPTVFDTELDTTGTRLELKVVVQDMNNILIRKSPHSLTFDLPFTETNNLFFRAFYDLNTFSSDWKASDKTYVQIRDSGTSIMDGALQLLNFDEEKKTYTCVILGQVADIFFSIKEATWRDVVGIDLDHESTAQNIIDSWDVTNDITNAAGPGVIVYPLIDNGDRFNQGWRMHFNNGINGGIGLLGSGIDPVNLKPSVQVKYLFEKIINYAGYAVSSNFFDSDKFSNLYMAVGTEQDNNVYRALYGFSVGRTTNLTCPTGVATAIGFSVESGSNFYDPDNLVVGGVFLSPAQGTFLFEFSVNFSTSGTGDFNLQFIVQAGGQNYSVNQTFTQGTQNTLSVNIAVSFTAQAQQAEAYIVHNASTDLTLISAGSSWQCNSYDVGGASQTLDIAEMLFTKGVSAFLKDITQYFNLAFVQYADDPTTIEVEPWVDLVEGGDKKDWTNKVDRSKGVVVSPTTEYQKTLRTYGYASVDDLAGSIATVQDGECVVTNGNDFATETEKYESLFSLLRSKRIPTVPTGFLQSSATDALIQVGYSRSDDGTYRQEKYAPWLAYYNGTRQFVQNNSGTQYYIDQISTNQFPLFSNFNEQPQTSATVGLPFVPYYQFGQLSPYATDVFSITEWNYKLYHQKTVESLRDTRAKILDCSLLLDAEDVAKLKWNDKIFIDQDYYRVIELSAFSVGNKRPVQARLIKSVLGAQSSCGQNWVGSNADGTTNWEDENGAVLPSQVCCEENGLMWDAATSTCRWKRPTRPYEGDEWTPIGEDSGIVDGGGIGTHQTNSFTNYSANGVNIHDYSVPVQVTADDTTNYEKFTTDGTNPFTINLRIAHTYQINLRVTGMVTAATGVFGNTAIGEFALAFKYDGSLARSIGTVQTLMTTGDWTINVNAATTGTRAATLELQVQGVAGQETVYTAVVNIVDVDLSSHYIPTPSDAGDALWQDANNIAYQNGDEMLWN